jgi:hypothetical protein
MPPILTGQHLRAMRVAAGYYQQDIAARIVELSIGHHTNQGTICKWELGYQKMTHEKISLYLEALDSLGSTEQLN